MTIHSLKAMVDAKRMELKAKAGHMAATSDRGPIGIDLIDAIVKVLEAHQKQIDELKVQAGRTG
jgi:hypothetical protein